MTDKELHDLIEREAYAIWQVRDRYGLPGDKEGDWLSAERNIRTRNAADILNISAYSRIQKYI